jgi:peptidoglycan/xylan/chitin deacetylase (PgdA/CDA1 family)
LDLVALGEPRLDGLRAAAFRRIGTAVRARHSAVLCYHGVGPGTMQTDPGFLRVEPAAFRAQVGLLLDAGFRFVTVAEFAERADGQRPPPGLVALSFDDGMDDNHRVVLPILQEHEIPATVFVTTGLIGKANPWMPAGSGARMMTVDELRDLASAGFEIGSHTVNHPDLSELDYETCLTEMVESRRALEDVLGTSIRTFAYPFCHYGPAAVAAAKEAGFVAAVTCHGRGGWNRYELRRSMISRKDGIAIFLFKLTDVYEPIYDSPPVRVLRAATRRARVDRRARREGSE